MAKGTSTAKTTTKPDAQHKTPAVQKKGGAVADPDMMKMMEGDAGRGVSTAMEDNIVPLLYILQSNSPQLDRADKAQYLKGAKAGDLWLRGTQTFIDADVENEKGGLLGIPCHFSKSWMEWKPNRGGLAGRHAERPKDAKQVTEETDDGGERQVWRLPNGNTVVETREHVYMITDEKVNGGKPLPIVVPMASTNHTASRQWMGLMNNVQVPGTDKTAPSYGVVYRLYTTPKKNEKGSWYMFQPMHAGEEDGSAVPLMVSDIALYKAAKKINADFTSGALKAETPEAPHEDESGAGGGKEDNSDM